MTRTVPDTLKRWKLVIEYNGGDYAGFQRQDNVETVQGVLEKAIHDFCQQDIKITVAGRTDAGVHALGQIAHFDLDYGDRELSGFELAKAINAHMIGHPISVIDAKIVSQDFHARFGAKTKLYVYKILNRSYRPALQKNLVWWVKRPLDIEKMRTAAEHLLGKHDFSTFRAAECQANSPIRTIDSIDITQTEIMGGADIEIAVKGKSFLHHQVRNIVGTLFLVGEGKWQPNNVKTALEAKDRKAGGPTAPASGLYLVSIDYDEEQV